MHNESKKSLRIIFAGSPEFACKALAALLQSSHQVIAVYTQPDKPAGRGLKLTASPVKHLALQHDLPLYQPATLKTLEAQNVLKALNADLMVVAAYGLILPKAVLDIFPLGCVNIHPSLLPRFRGAAPIQRTIHAGDKISGVTIMHMDEGLDTGPILYQENYTLSPDETSQSLHDVMAALGAKALVHTLYLIAENKIQSIAQDNTHATYANKLSKEEALIDWQKSADTLENEIRAFNPWPVSHTVWKNNPLRIWFAKKMDGNTTAIPGTIVYANEQGLDIATGDGILRILKLQLPGGKPLSITDFYHAKQQELIIGQLFQ